MGTVIPIQELPQDLTLAPPVLGIVPTPQHSHEEPCTSPCAASHVAEPLPPHPAPLEELLWGALGEAHSSPAFQASFPTLFLLQHLGSGYGPGSPCPEVMPAFPPVSVSLAEPGKAWSGALASLSPLGTSGRDSIAKNQFQEVCQIPGNQASTRFLEVPAHALHKVLAQPLERTQQRLLLLWVNLLKGSEPGWASCMPTAL